MPLFGLIKKSKKTKDQQSTDSNLADERKSVSSTASNTTGANSASGGAVTNTTSNTTTSSKNLGKSKSDQSSNLTPVRTISHKTPNPFTQPVNIPKSPTKLTPEVDSRMYSASPFSTSPQPDILPQSSAPQQQQLQNVVTGQYNAPPTPPSTAQSGSIDDKLESLTPIAAGNAGSPNDQLKQPQPQQAYPIRAVTSDATISSSGLLTPVASTERFIPSRLPNPHTTTNTIRPTKGKYSIADFSIQRTLGTGSFGRVHLVQSRHNSRFYAIKVSSVLSPKTKIRFLKSSKLSK